MKIVASLKAQILQEILRRHAAGVECTYDYLVSYFAKDRVVARRAVAELVKDGFLHGESDGETARMALAENPHAYDDNEA